MYYLSKQEQLLAEIRRLLEAFPDEALPAFEEVVDRIVATKEY